MPYYVFLWTEQIIAHLAEHGVTPEEFEYVVMHPTSEGSSRSTGNPVVRGYTQTGRYLMTVFEQLDEATIIPVTAYEVPMRGQYDE